MDIVAGALVAYLLGSIPTAYLVVRLATGRDIREVGSGNVGALNVKRATGSLALALLTLLTDVAKTFLALWTVERFFPAALPFAPFFLVLGHNYPVWTGFKGGRGIAVLLASALYLDPQFAVTWVLVWAVGYLLSGYIAVGAMAAHILTPIVEKVLFGEVAAPLVLALIPVWMRYLEKAELLARGQLRKHYWGGER